MENLIKDINSFIDSLDEDTKAILKGIGHFSPKLNKNDETTDVILSEKPYVAGLQVIESDDVTKTRRK